MSVPELEACRRQALRALRRAQCGRPNPTREEKAPLARRAVAAYSIPPKPPPLLAAPAAALQLAHQHAARHLGAATFRSLNARGKLRLGAGTAWPLARHRLQLTPHCVPQQQHWRLGRKIVPVAHEHRHWNFTRQEHVHPTSVERWRPSQGMRTTKYIAGGGQRAAVDVPGPTHVYALHAGFQRRQVETIRVLQQQEEQRAGGPRPLAVPVSPLACAARQQRLVAQDQVRQLPGMRARCD